MINKEILDTTRLYTVQRYSDDKERDWNDFLNRSKNGNFLLNRQYMGYHSDRFKDHSLLIFRGSKLIALFPANQRDKTTISSHDGLTYGGLVTTGKVSTEQVVNIFNAINEYYKALGVRTIVYKPSAWVFHDLPSEEDLYAITNLCEARLVTRAISSSIRIPNRPTFSQSRRTAVHHAEKAGLIVKETEDYETFWHILDDNLMERHQKHPVHSIAELQLLHSRFPDKIRLFMAYQEEKCLGGILMYDCGVTAHTQYISANAEGKELGAIDIIMNYLLTEVFDNKRFLDFGISTEDDGHYLNTSLIFQKEGFGGRGVCYDKYEWNL